MRPTALFAALTIATNLAAQEPAEGKRYALLVGVNKYDNGDLSTLKYAENDVAALRDQLNAAGFRRVVLLTDAEVFATKDKTLFPTGANIRNHLSKMLSGCKPEDTLILAFAGHGVEPNGANGLHFCPQDATLSDPKTLVPLNEVYEQLKACKAGVRFLIADACRNDPLSGRSATAKDLKSLTRPPLPTPPSGVASLFSCSQGQKAFESDRHKHGFLFHAIIEGLSGKAAGKDGAVDVLALVAYAVGEVPNAVKDERGPLADQTPELSGTVRGRAILASIAKLSKSH